MGKVVPLRPDDEGRPKRSRTDMEESKVVRLPSAEPKREPLLGPVSSLIDEAFADAVARGLMDDLPGKGQPLPPSFFREDPYQPAQSLDQKILSEAGLIPEWLKLRKQISLDLEWVRANRGLQGRRDRSGDPVRPDPTWEERVRRLNEAIHKFNRICPPMMQIPLYKPEFDV
jgi:hypothetical protein